MYPTPLLPRLAIPTSTVPPMIRPRRHARFSPSSATLLDFVPAFPISGKCLSGLTFRISVPVKVAQGEAGWPHRALLPYGLEFLIHGRSHDSIHDPLSSAMTIDSYPIWHRSGMHTTGAKGTCIIVFTSCFPTASHTSGHGFLLNICSYKGCSIRIMLYTVITNSVTWNASTTVIASTGACARRHRQCWLQLRKRVLSLSAFYASSLLDRWWRVFVLKFEGLVI